MPNESKTAQVEFQEKRHSTVRHRIFTDAEILSMIPDAKHHATYELKLLMRGWRDRIRREESEIEYWSRSVERHRDTPDAFAFAQRSLASHTDRLMQLTGAKQLSEAA